MITLCLFSKHLHWAGVREAAEITAGLGYDGIDLTVRAGGHVLPERVEEDLPKAAEAIRKAGIAFPMVTTDIVDARTPHAERVLKTLAALNVRLYRWGPFRYDFSRPIPEQLAGFKSRAQDLAAMNAQFGVCAMYHTHSGLGLVGASMWDLYLILKDLNQAAVGVNYDIAHATVEGGYGGWMHSARLLAPYMKGLAVKDFRWVQNAQGAWVPGWCSLGSGMVSFERFLPILKGSGFSGPIQVHMEYPEAGGAEDGSAKLAIPRERLLGFMRSDLARLKEYLSVSGFAGASATR